MTISIFYPCLSFIKKAKVEPSLGVLGKGGTLVSEIVK